MKLLGQFQAFLFVVVVVFFLQKDFTCTKSTRNHKKHKKAQKAQEANKQLSSP